MPTSLLDPILAQMRIAYFSMEIVLCPEIHLQLEAHELAVISMWHSRLGGHEAPDPVLPLPHAR